MFLKHYIVVVPQFGRNNCITSGSNRAQSVVKLFQQFLAAAETFVFLLHAFIFAFLAEFPLQRFAELWELSGTVLFVIAVEKALAQYCVSCVS